MESLIKKINSFYPLPIFTKHSILDVCPSSEYASDLLKLLLCGSKRDKQEGSDMPNWLYYSLQTKNFPIFWSHTWKYNILANERLTNVEEKWSTIKFDVFVFYFIFFVPMAQ